MQDTQDTIYNFDIYTSENIGLLGDIIRGIIFDGECFQYKNWMLAGLAGQLAEMSFLQERKEMLTSLAAQLAEMPSLQARKEMLVVLAGQIDERTFLGERTEMRDHLVDLIGKGACETDSGGGQTRTHDYAQHCRLAYWIDLEAAQKLTHYHVQHLRSLARRRFILSYKYHGKWYLYKPSLIGYARSSGRLPPTPVPASGGTS